MSSQGILKSVVGAPNVITMSRDFEDTLSASRGLVVVQGASLPEAVCQAFGLPLELENEFSVKVMPDHRHALTTTPGNSTESGWRPTGEQLNGLAPIMSVQERSDFLQRVGLMCCGCANLRGAKLFLEVQGGQATAHAYEVDKACRPGGMCCFPHQMTVARNSGNVYEPNETIGRVKEEYEPYLGKCLMQLLQCTSFHSVDRWVETEVDLTADGHMSVEEEEELTRSLTADAPLLAERLGLGNFVPRYRLRANMCCFQGRNNLCGGTCCNHNAVWDIEDLAGRVVGKVQMSYAPGNDMLTSLCRMVFRYNNYVVEFPKDSTAEDRVLLLCTVLQQNYQYKERTGTTFTRGFRSVI